MTPSRSLAAAALALGALACTEAKSTPAGVRLRQPAAVAVFQGRTLQDPTSIHPYVVVANAYRNDLSVLDAATNLPVASPIKLRTLVLGVADRPSFLAAASLGDDTPEQRRADLLVAVSAGDSVLQLVETWSSANVVHSDPDEVPKLAVDLGHDVLALAPVPSAPGTARIAAALSDRRVAIVEYARGTDGESIALVSSTIGAALPFQPQAIAAMPDDPEVDGVQTALYVATRDEIEPGIRGVAELSPDDLSTPRALGARGPTRLVAAARLRERLPASAASDRTAFGFTIEDPPPDPLPPPQPLVPRVYAVLDESGCGTTRPIDCGIVALDPEMAAPPASIPQAIPPDYAGLMPYRAPMRIPARALGLAVSAPPEKWPEVTGEPDYSPEPGHAGAEFMRIYMGAIGRATTAVAAVPAENGFLYFLDLGRFETATSAPVIASRTTGAPSADYVRPTEESTLDEEVRLWVQKPDGTFASVVSAQELRDAVTTTPGFTADERWRLIWQGYLASTLFERSGEVGRDPATSQLWLALQAGEGPAGGPRSLNQVVRLWHPALGVRANDILVIKVGGMPAGCVGTPPPSATAEYQFELRISSLLPPSDAYPGGAVLLQPIPPPAPGVEDPWFDCYEALSDAVTGAGLWTGLRVSVRAQGLVLVGETLGYAGRPELGQPPLKDPDTGEDVPGTAVVSHFELAYPGSSPSSPGPEDEDELAAICPLADWDGIYPLLPGVDPRVLDCGGTCDRARCEQLVLARKARRLANLSVDCGTDPADTTACELGTPGAVPPVPPRWPPDQYPFPVVNGPALGLQVAVQSRGGQRADPVRDLLLELAPSSGLRPLSSNPSGVSPYQASGAVAFDRTPWTDATAGYRFYVSFPADFVLDTTPSQTPVPSIVIR